MKRVLVLLCGLLLVQHSFAQQNTPLVVASYNLRYHTANDGVNAWPNRKEMVKNLVRYHAFDLFGTQEGLRPQLNDLAELEEYAFVGKGRDDGREAGEHSAIFYRKDRFRLLQSGDFWLSQTPDRPSLGWDATCCNRICSWARFKDLRTDREFYLFSAHFDHQGVEARRQSGKLMVEKIRQIAGTAPVVFAGDLNSTPDTEQVQTLQTFLQDAFQVSAAPPYGPAGTFNGFKADAPLENRIDYVFVSKGIRVLKYGVLTDQLQQRYPSDHLPVVAEIILP
ncbi:MAG: endonuclease/exonuclease/phosphatase family protein [Cytophagales bacterium]|nr:endonuclease/exonuclease/phosphatase family protein [Cytophagales bacterium]